MIETSDVHPHDFRREIPDRLSPEELRELSRLDEGRAALLIGAQWVGAIAAIALCMRFPHWWLWALSVPWIGARQAALTVLLHDAVHYRLFKNRVVNDALGNLLCGWPVFITVEGFRNFHPDHHRFTAAPGDGNRVLWKTHSADGVQVPEWRYPTSRGELVRRLLVRAAGPTGAWWMIRGILGTFRLPAPRVSRLGKLACYAIVAAALTRWGGWSSFFWYWAFPLCTWQVFIQYLRLICEHSGIPGAGEYAVTRTTIPGVLGRLFVLPLHIGYHIEHHWYPSVPLYRLPELHRALWARPGFAANAVVRRSLAASLAEVARG